MSSANRVLGGVLHFRTLEPAAAVAAGLGAAGCLLGYAVWSGLPSGAGGGLSVFGVLKRPELDLRAPALLGARSPC